MRTSRPRPGLYRVVFTWMARFADKEVAIGDGFMREHGAAGMVLVGAHNP